MRLVALLVLAAKSRAFVVPLQQHRPAPRAFFVPTAAPASGVWLHLQRLSELDEICIENVAEYCLKAENALAADGGECDVEEYQALVNQLRDQRKILADHVAYVDSLLDKLQANGSGSTAEQEETYFAG